MEARATLALKPGVWFRRGRLLIVSPDSLGTACPLSGRNSTYRLVQILEAGSHIARTGLVGLPFASSLAGNDAAGSSVALLESTRLSARARLMAQNENGDRSLRDILLF